MAKRLKQLVETINKLIKSGMLGKEDELFLRKALKDLGHALSVKDPRKIEDSVNRICKVFLEKMR